MGDDRPMRPASCPDDPSASFADRLLLALGMWPHHVEQMGTEAAIDAAVMIRTDAHKFPMAAEDYGTMRERCEFAETFVRDLAAAAARPDGKTCKFCGSGDGHTDECLWQRARLYVAEECEACDGFGDCAACDGEGCRAPDTDCLGLPMPRGEYCQDGTCPRCNGSGLILPEASDA